ncbi:MAG: hypothetical protein ACTSP7_12695 [Candidatus Heimdallarchaeota archaeon]
MVKKAKFVFDYENLNTQLDLEEIVALISTGDRNSPEYGLTLMILRTLLSKSREMSKDQMYDLFMRNREHISKASFYRILSRLQYRGMIVFDKETNKYRPAIHFSNALQKLAISWETLVTEQK